YSEANGSRLRLRVSHQSRQARLGSALQPPHTATVPKHLRLVETRWHRRELFRVQLEPAKPPLQTSLLHSLPLVASASVLRLRGLFDLRCLAPSPPWRASGESIP